MPNSNNSEGNDDPKMVNLFTQINPEFAAALAMFVEKYSQEHDHDLVETTVALIYIAADAIALMAEGKESTPAGVCELSYSFYSLLHACAHDHEKRHQAMSAKRATDEVLEKVFSNKRK